MQQLHAMMQSMPAPALALLLVHILGDFPLQGRAMVAGKRAGRRRALAAHLAVHLVLSTLALLMFAQGSFARWETGQALMTILVGHALLDVTKSRVLRSRPALDGALLFAADQILHVGVVLVAAAWLPEVTYTPFVQVLRELRIAQYLPHSIVFVVTVFPTGYLIRYLLAPLGDQLDHEKNSDQGLKDAGLILGCIERGLLLFAFALGSMAAVGLIVGAKSAARFPEFKDRAFAEYFLIGTLLSVALAGLGGAALAALVS